MATSTFGNGSASSVIGNWTVVDKTSSDAAWAIPSSANVLNVLIIGGGGGGGSGALSEVGPANAEAQGGGGGGGGAALFLKNLDVSYLKKYNFTIPIVIGAGGSGGAIGASSSGAAGAAGTVGGTSSFGPFSAPGGSGGAGGFESNATQYTAASGGDAGSVTGSRMILASPVTTAQLSDFMFLSSIASMGVTEYIKITGGSGSVGGAINIATTNTYVNPISATSPTSTAFTPSAFDWSSIFSAGSTGAGTFVSRTSTAGAGSTAGFCGGGGAGGCSYQNDTNSSGNAGYLLAFPTAGVAGGGGGGGGNENSQSGHAGGAGAANSGGGGGGGGGADAGSRDGTTVPTNNGGAGGSGRVIIWYRA